MSTNLEKLTTEFQALKKELDDADDAYYNSGHPIMTDDVYDQKKKALIEMTQKLSNIVADDINDIKDKVGHFVKGKKVRHSTPMLSLDNIFSKPGELTMFDQTELEKWVKKIKRSLREQGVTDDIKMTIEPKYDGLALSLIYDGQTLRLKDAVTRGDGVEGETVYLQALEINGIKHRLDLATQEGEIIIRGEILMSRKNFNALNDIMTEQGVRPYLNPRNAAVGILKSGRMVNYLTFYPYDIIMDDRQLHLNSYSYAINCFLSDLGFKGADNVKEAILGTDEKDVETIEYFKDFYRYVHLKRKELFPFDIDGLVLKVDDYRLRPLLGTGSRFPHWAIAYKLPPEETMTKLLNIDVQIGRTGQLTPVARLEPVFVGGTTITNVTLHNEDQVNVKGLQIGDTVVVRRAGDVIPEITGVISPGSETRKPYSLPSVCPCCQIPTVRIGKKVFCINPDCDEVQVQKLIYFVSKDGVNLMGYGEETIRKLYQAGELKTPADLYDVNKLGNLEYLRKVLRKVADRDVSTPTVQLMLGNLDKTRRFSSMNVLIRALGIPNVGKGVSSRFCSQFNNMNELLSADENTIRERCKEEDLGNVVTESLVDYFRNPVELKALLDKGVTTVDMPTRSNQESLGKVCITGGFLTYPRTVIEQKLISKGYQIVSGVSKGIVFLACGENPGSKKDKALTLGVRIIDEKELLSIIS